MFRKFKINPVIKFLSLTLIFLFVCGLIFNLNIPIPTNQQSQNKDPNTTPIYVLAIITEAKGLTQIASSQSPDSLAQDNGGIKQVSQEVTAKIIWGQNKNESYNLNVPLLGTQTEKLKLSQSDLVILLKGQNTTENQFYYADKFRLVAVVLIFLIFLALVIFFARLKGILSLAGLSFSILIILRLLIPGILNGLDPYWLSIGVVGVSAIASLYLAHGFHKRTTIATIGIIITLFLAAGLASLFASLAKLSGMGSEESVYLQFGALQKADFQGLFLAGVMIGVLGVLDDIATAQVTIVHELKNANFAFTTRELYNRAIRVGKEHIASLVNTLAFAYIGSSFALILSLYLNQSNQPWWLILNNEMIVEQIVNTLVGSSALVLGVPITTAISSFYYGQLKNRNEIKELKMDTNGVHLDPNQIQNEVFYRTKGEPEITKWLKR